MTGMSGNGEGLTPRVRTRRRRALDAATARIFKMPPGHHDYTLTRALRVPMRDGVELLTDVYAPVGKSLGTLLIRTPYGRTGLIALVTAGYYATQGYHVVNQSCRGTFGSGGDFEPFSREVDDGADTLAWLRRQARVWDRCRASSAQYGFLLRFAGRDVLAGRARARHSVIGRSLFSLGPFFEHRYALEDNDGEPQGENREAAGVGPDKTVLLAEEFAGVQVVYDFCPVNAVLGVALPFNHSTVGRRVDDFIGAKASLLVRFDFDV